MTLICSVLQLYVVLIIASAILSWFPTEPGSGLAQVRELLHRATDPVIGPVRRMLGASLGPIDFSPIIVIVGLQLLAASIC